MENAQSQKIADDEIDLIELAVKLWSQKWLILLVTVICTAIGVGYALLAPQKWTSKTRISPVDYSKLGQYYQVLGKISISKSQPVPSAAKVAKEMFSDFLYKAQSANLSSQFFAQSPLLEAELKGKSFASDVQKQHQIRILNELFLQRQVKISFPSDADLKDKNSVSKYPSISITANTPELAQETLKQFLIFTNNHAYQSLAQNLVAQIQDDLNKIALQMAQIENQVKYRKQILLQRLEQAYQIAKAAGVTTAQGKYSDQALMLDALAQLNSNKTESNNISNGAFLSQMGTDNLQAQIDTFKNTPVVYPLAYYDLKVRAEFLENNLQVLTNLTPQQLYQYIESPTYPVKRDAPKRTLIVVVALILGLILGVLLALVRMMIMNYKEQQG